MELTDFDFEKAETAYTALSAYVEKQENNDIFGDAGKPIDLQVCLKKYPGGNKKVKVFLPHSLVREEDDVCVFVKDIDAKDVDVTKRHYEDLFRQKGVKKVSQVICMRELKTEYKEYEAKRKLSNLFCVFLADERIVRLLPALLGKAFYDVNKKVPVQVDVTATDLNSTITKALTCVSCQIKAASCQLRVGHTKLDKVENLANIREGITKMVENVPGGAANVRSLHLRTHDSPALLIYTTPNASAEDVVIPRGQRKKDFVGDAEEVTPIEGAKVVAVGNVDFKMVKSKKRAKAVKKPKQTKKTATEETKEVTETTKKVKKNKADKKTTEETTAPLKKKRKISV